MNEFFQLACEKGPHSSLVVVQHAFEELETILKLCFQCINEGKVTNYLVNIFAQWLLVKLRCCSDDFPHTTRCKVKIRSLCDFFEIESRGLFLEVGNVLDGFKLPKIKNEKDYYIETYDRMKERICDGNSSFFEELALLDRILLTEK
jgi:hypothetical protein